MGKRGPRKKLNPKSKLFSFRVTPDQKEMVDAIANGPEWRELITGIANAAALRKQGKISFEDWQAVVFTKTQQTTGIK